MSGEDHFGPDIAAAYDAQHQSDPEELNRTVDVPAELTGQGEALEFAIGTGRVALPLAKRGVQVDGIELSSSMIEMLKAKPTGADLNVVVGDMASASMNRQYELVYLVFNTIDNLTTQEAQIACFENASRHLRAGGSFVVETLVPPLQRLPQGERLLAFDRTDSHWGMDEFDVVTQNYTSHHMHRDGSTYRAHQTPFRYAWPTELDLMARIAGLEFWTRWGGWDKSEFTALCRKHVSVWRKPDNT